MQKELNRFEIFLPAKIYGKTKLVYLKMRKVRFSKLTEMPFAACFELRVMEGSLLVSSGLRKPLFQTPEKLVFPS